MLPMMGEKIVAPPPWTLPSWDGRWLVFLKEAGMTSADAVRKVKRLLGVHKVGHAGTLDPFATGVLPMALNRATHTVSFAVDTRKEYKVVAIFGRSTDTHDKDGTTTASHDTLPSLEKIQESCTLLEQRKTQRPPSYSAIRVRGKHAYERARNGEKVILLERKIDPITITIESWKTPVLSLKVQCGKGFYIRSLVRDLGVLCASGAYVEHLERVRVGIFKKEMALSLEQLSFLVHNASLDRLEKALFPLDTTLGALPKVRLQGDDVRRLLNGCCVSLSPQEAQDSGASVDFLEDLENSQKKHQDEGRISVVYYEDIPVALSRIYAQRLSTENGKRGRESLCCVIRPKKLLSGHEEILKGETTFHE